MSNYSLLLVRLNEFIRKYYLNRLLRGVLYTVGFVLVLYLSFVLFEYVVYASSTLRSIMLLVFISSSIIAFAYWVLWPLAQYFFIGKTISHEQAAQIIGVHFGNVQDKLLNVLHLQKQANQYQYNEAALIHASINQKIENLKPIPFQQAIDLAKNKKYLRYALPPLFLLLMLFVIAPNILREGTTRLLNPSKVYAPKAPFSFVLLNNDLEVMQYENLEINATTEGLVAPKDLYLVQDGYTYKMGKNEQGNFTYTLNKIQSNTKFYLKSGEYNSAEYEVNVIMKPAMRNLKAIINYPSYIGKPTEEVNYIGDMTLPQGSTVEWQFETMHTTEAEMLLNGSPVELQADGESYNYQHRFMENSFYSISLSNDKIQNQDTNNYFVNVIADQYPGISVEQFTDSTENGYFWFYGDVSDDYGISSVQFVYKIESENSVNATINKPIQATLNGNNGTFNYTVSAKNLALKSGQKVTYYFEVYDNDGVNGKKSSRSQIYTFKLPSKDEMKKQTEQSKEEIKEKLEDAMKDANKMKKEFDQIQKKILDKKQINSDDKKQLQNLIDKQNEFDNRLQDLKTQFEQTIQQENEYKEKSEDILRKEELLKDLFEKTMDKEMQDLLKKMEELMEKLNKDEALQKTEEMEMNNEQLNKELDQMLNLFKRMEMEEKIQETVQKLEDLAKKEDELADKTENNSESKDKLEKEQEDLEKQLDEARKDVEDIEKKNAELGNANDDKMEQAKKEGEQAKKNVDNAQEKMKENDSKKASKNQKNAAENMQQMANKLQQMMNKKQSEELEMNIKALRQILENLVQTSFDQESLMDKVVKTNINEPAYVSNMGEQQRIKDNYQIIEDSLNMLSKRMFELGALIQDELESINKHLPKSIQYLEMRQVQPTATEQQYTMTSLNNLALLLSEVMQNLQMQQKNQMQGNGSCNNPGGKGSGMGDIMKQQQQLADKITKQGEAQGKEGKEGKKKGQSQGGQQSGSNEGMNSKEIAQMAAKQAAIRNALQELNTKENKNGNGKYGNLDQIIKEMNKVEEDLVNKRLSNDMLKRQQEIMTRLLEADKANRQQEQDEKRKSETAQEPAKTIPPALQEYIKKRQSELNEYRTVPALLNPYYKKLVQQYFETIGGK